VAKAEQTRAEFQEQARRTEEMMAENAQWTKRIFAELDDQRDERRALIESLLRLTDQFPPPPPNLRSA
jgi:DNA anti-recombination protein RmuC